MKTIPETIINQPISGLNLTGHTLGEQLGSDPTLLVFLRHFG
ncbi:MAG: hypothetical protein QNJ45_21350 [Ardenticatenaceae bacterium]|nr:hypothetical protein [Ardenticatenaceae bacterium]